MGLLFNNPKEEMDLRKLLEEVIKLLKENNLLPKDADNKSIIDNVMKNLKEDPKFIITKESLKDPKIKQTLAVACIAQHTLGNNFDLGLLLAPQSQLTPNDLTKQLKAIFDKALELKLKDKNKSPEEIAAMQKQLHTLAEKLTPRLMAQFKKLDKNAKGHENQQLSELVTGMLDSCSQLKTQFYGTHQPGAVSIPVFQMVGNLVGALDMESDISKPSFMSQEDNPIGPDPLGTKIDSLVSTVANGGAIIDTPLEQQIIDAVSPQAAETHYTPSPFSTKPKPPGSVGE